jgi:hypothetical protein
VLFADKQKIKILGHPILIQNMPCKATLKAFAKFLTIRAQNRKKAQLQ